jgi:phage/plasmid primase-like uncharacterized protein
MHLIDVTSRDTRLKKVASTHGSEYAGPCPWCGGEDRFRVWPDAEKPGYWCRQCDRKGDAIEYLRDRHDLTFGDACAHLGQPLPNAPYQRSIPKPPPLAEAPGATWQAKAQAFTAGCEQVLWTSGREKTLAYLYGRGMRDETIRAARIGYQAATTREKPDAWGSCPTIRRSGFPKGSCSPGGWAMSSGAW